MNTNQLVNSLVIAVINPDFYGRKVFATFLVQEQNADMLKVLPLWDEDYPESYRGYLEGWDNSVRVLKVEDVWVFPASISKAKEEKFKELGIEYHFHNDEKALERFATKLGMDKVFIGYEGEPEDGTWFDCCRVKYDALKILPKDFYIYSLRASEIDDSQPAFIEEKVVVNHYGDILTDKPLQVPIELEVEPIEYDDEGNIIN